MKHWNLTLKPGRLALGAATLTLVTAQAADGLPVPSAEATWPQWQARLSMQAGAPSPLSLSGLIDPTSNPRGPTGMKLLGDYYFAPTGQGGFRASGGLMFAPQAPSLARPGPVFTAGESLPAATYLGLGYSTLALRNGLSLSADLGLATERPGSAWGAARALFGNAGTESALRELRLSPVLQLGLQLSF